MLLLLSLSLSFAGCVSCSLARHCKLDCAFELILPWIRGCSGNKHYRIKHIGI